MPFTLRTHFIYPILLLTGTAYHASASYAQAPDAAVLETITVEASADANHQGIPAPFAGKQVGSASRIGILGNRSPLESPFQSTSYTQQLIQNQQARSVADVLLNDPAVRQARGYGNFQETYFMRGFIVNSDSVSYNGLFGVLPRQYISSEIFERVEVLRGASGFLMGASPSGDGIGGTINLLPKRAAHEDLHHFYADTTNGGKHGIGFDVSSRLGEDKATGIRWIGVKREGGTPVHHENSQLSATLIGFDWHSNNIRLSADIGYQDHQLQETRSSVLLANDLPTIPHAPNNRTNWALKGTYANERVTFGSLRAELDLSDRATAWIALGGKSSKESNVLANFTLQDSASGNGSVYRFDNIRRDNTWNSELGSKGQMTLGGVLNEWVVAFHHYRGKERGAYAFDYANTLATNLYRPTRWSYPQFTSGTIRGNDFLQPAINNETELKSFAVGDTLHLLNDQLLLTLGVRHQTIVAKNFAYNSGEQLSHYHESVWSPAMGAVLKIHPHISAYANYIEGLSKGDIAPNEAINRGESLRPYRSKQKEIGLKYETQSLGGAITYFQTQKPNGILNDSLLFTNAGKHQHQGIELSAYGEILKGLRVLGGITWLDAKQKGTGSASTEDKRVIGVPKNQATLNVEWDVPTFSGLTVDTRWIYTGRTYASADNRLSVPSWKRLDLGVRYVTSIQNYALTFRARIDNVTNQSYWASSGGYSNLGYLVSGAPRTFSLSLSLEF